MLEGRYAARPEAQYELHVHFADSAVDQSLAAAGMELDRCGIRFRLRDSCLVPPRQ